MAMGNSQPRSRGFLTVLFLGTAISTSLAIYASRQTEVVSQSQQRLSELINDERHQRAVEFAGCRGWWNEALRLCEKSLNENPNDATWFRIERVRALDALQRYAEARKAIQELAREGVPAAYQGAVLLWQGDLKLIGGESSDAFDTIVQARKSGLSSADDAYAAALLADRTVDAIAALEQVPGVPPI